MKRITPVILMGIIGFTLLFASHVAAATPWRSGSPSNVAFRGHHGFKSHPGFHNHPRFNRHRGFNHHRRFNRHRGFKPYRHFGHHARRRGGPFIGHPHHFRHSLRYFKHHKYSR